MSAERPPRTLTIYDLGRVDYDRALALQRRLVEQRQREAIGDTLLLLEHPAVITMGRSGDQGDILADEATLLAAGVAVRRVERGGQVTYHGPGQLVGYIIVHLYRRQRALRQFIRNVEQLFIDVLAERYGLTADRHERYRGVWLGQQKVAAIGIAVKQAVTMHGFACNIAPDMRHFEFIVPCGIRDLGQTSIAQALGRPVSLPDIIPPIAHHFCAIFGYAPRPVQQTTAEALERRLSAIDS